MKKRVKDLTLEEASNYCSKRKSCRDCPLMNICSVEFGRMSSWILLKEEIDLNEAN